MLSIFVQNAHAIEFAIDVLIGTIESKRENGIS